MDNRSLKESIERLREIDIDEIKKYVETNAELMDDPNYMEVDKKAPQFPEAFIRFLERLKHEINLVTGNAKNPEEAAENLLNAIPELNENDIGLPIKLELIHALTRQIIAHEENLITSKKMPEANRKHNDRDDANIYTLYQALSSKIVDPYFKDGHLQGILNILEAANKNEKSDQISEMIKTVQTWGENFDTFTTDNILEVQAQLKTLSESTKGNQSKLLALASDSLGGADGVREKSILDLAARSPDKKPILQKILSAFKNANASYPAFYKEIDSLIKMVNASSDLNNLETLKPIIMKMTDLMDYEVTSKGLPYSGNKIFLTIARKLCQQLLTPQFLQQAQQKMDESNISIIDYYQLKENAKAMRVDSQDIRPFLEAYRNKILRQKANELGINNTEQDGKIEKFIADKTKSFNDFSNIMLMETLLQTFPLEKIEKQVENLFPIKASRDEFNQGFFDYKMRHAYEVWNWQMDLTVEGLKEKTQTYLKEQNDTFANKPHVLKELDDQSMPYSKKFAARAKAIDDNHEAVNRETYNFTVNMMKNIKQLIETTSWKAGFKILNLQIGGEKIKLSNGEKKIVPAKVAKIYKEISKAEKDADYLKHFNEMIKIGMNASNSKPLSFFNLNKRDEKTQVFYDLFKKAISEQRKIMSTIK